MSIDLKFDISDYGLITGNQFYRQETEVKNLIKERDDLCRILRRLLAEMPAAIRDQENPFQEMVTYLAEVRDREARLDVEHRAAQRRASEAEIALAESKESCTCGAIEHAQEGAAKLFRRLDGTLSEPVECEWREQNQQRRYVTEWDELKRKYQQMAQQQQAQFLAAPPVFVKSFDFGKLTPSQVIERQLMPDQWSNVLPSAEPTKAGFIDRFRAAMQKLERKLGSVD